MVYLLADSCLVMSSWKLDLDEDFFRIYDAKKMIMGYFDPDYGEIHPPDKRDQIIESMLKNHDKIPGGAIMTPMVKFGMFDTDLATGISTVQNNVLRVNGHINKWKEFLSNLGCLERHVVRISHTDQDMLTVTFPVRFSEPTPLEKNALIARLEPTLHLLQKSGLS